MSKMRLLRAGQTGWDAWKGVSGTRIARLVGTKLSKTIGAGILEIEKNTIPSTIDYDEIIVVLEGQFRSTLKGEVFNCSPGDVLWIPANTSFTLETDSKARIFYVRYPMDPSIAGAD